MVRFEEAAASCIRPADWLSRCLARALLDVDGRKGLPQNLVADDDRDDQQQRQPQPHLPRPITDGSCLACCLSVPEMRAGPELCGSG